MPNIGKRFYFRELVGEIGKMHFCCVITSEGVSAGGDRQQSLQRIKSLILVKMTFTEKHIVEAYSGLFEGLSARSKKELIEQLSKSLEGGDNARDAAFFKSFGAFASKKRAGAIAKDIKSGRKFREKIIKL